MTKFTDLPLTKETLKGLQQSHYTDLTDIQKSAIFPALKGRDILGSAPTGSGKTLAFLIPILERLYHQKWNRDDGLGALIITPTRELALQIYKELGRIGRCHEFSAGLIIGGKDAQTEAERINSINILIATPGRLLYHMDQTAQFTLDNLQILVLDETDRILDSGFKKTLDAIIDNVPGQRQTLLFSATQTTSVSNLARLSLSSPEYINTTPPEKNATPDNLEQFYILTELPDKLTNLYSFLKTHLQSKIIVFFASSKQVRFVYETFRKLQPGIPLIQLHGKQKQQARIDATAKFSKTRHACLFATDIVARGIDFPTVDWVVQVDAPDDTATYIHRVGRTARSKKEGKALLFLTPKEETGMLANLETRNIPISKLKVKESKRKAIQDKLQALCFSDPEIKYLGQKAFITYVRSIYLQHDKNIFNVEDLPLEEFAASLGLPGAPKLKINANAVADAKKRKNIPHSILRLQKTNEDGELIEDEKDQAVRTKYDRMFERKNQNVLSEHYQKLAGNVQSDDDDDDFMKMKRVDHDLSDEEESAAENEEADELDNENNDTKDGINGPTSKRAQKRALSKKQVVKGSVKTGTKIKFDDEGKPHALYELENLDDFKKKGDVDQQISEFLGKERKEMSQRDVEDKEADRVKRQDKKRRRREFEKAAFEREMGIGEGDEYEYSQDDEAEELEETTNRRERRRKLAESEGFTKEERVPGMFSRDDDDFKDGDFFKHDDESDQNEKPRPTKRHKQDKVDKKHKKKKVVVELDNAPSSVQDLEALATQLIQS